MKQLDELVGQELYGWIPVIHKTNLQPIRLHGVESGGVWLESDLLTQTFLTDSEKPALQKPLFFVPFQQIGYLVQPSGEIALSEKAFGLEGPDS